MVQLVAPGLEVFPRLQRRVTLQEFKVWISKCRIIQLCLTRDPSLMFDLLTMSSADPPPSGPQ
ncbi:unnamed protein product, partial [Boreogadus saida]